MNIDKLEGMLAAYEIVLAHLLHEAGPAATDALQRTLPDIPKMCTQETIERILIAAEVVAAPDPTPAGTH
jgi:hypothetical protein